MESHSTSQIRLELQNLLGEGADTLASYALGTIDDPYIKSSLPRMQHSPDPVQLRHWVTQSAKVDPWKCSLDVMYAETRLGAGFIF